LGKIRTFNSSKKEIFYVMINKRLNKCTLEFTLNLDQFQQKDICWFIHEMIYIFNIVNLIFVNNNIFLNTLLNELQYHLFILAFE
jgi:hypothetical protein